MSDNENGSQPSHSNAELNLATMQVINLPGNVWYLVQDPKITKAEIKVTLAVLFNSYGNGVQGPRLSFTDLKELTNISPASVNAGLNSAIARGSIFKREAGGKIFYEPTSKKFEPMTCHDMNHDSSKILNSSNKQKTCHVSEIELRQKFLQQLLEFGLASHVAQNIALTDRYKIELLEEQLDYISFEHENGLLPKQQRAIPGYIVNRIKYNRIAPQGYATGGDSWLSPDEAKLVER